MTTASEPSNDMLVMMLRHGELCSEYREGEWCQPGEGEAWAVITYTDEPSPETGHVGWCWWAQGWMGEAPTLAAARTAAEQALRIRQSW